MRFKQNGNKRDLIAMVIHNADTVTIPVGTPVALVMNGTNDGLDVQLPSTLGAAYAHALSYGVALGPVAVGAYGEAIVFGFVQDLVIVQQTRASSTATWNSQASVAQNVLLNIDTVANGFDVGGTLASTNYLPFAILGQSLASFASSASATSDTRTAITTMAKGFVRFI